MAQKPTTINPSTGFPIELVPSTTGPATAGNLIAANGAGAVDPTLMPGGSPVATGPGAAGVLVKTNGSGIIDPSLLGAIGVNSVNVPANGAIPAGAAVNIYSNAGVLTMRVADNTTPLKANGWAPSAVTSGANGQADLGQGMITGLTGLTVGADYFLGTSGALTTTPPTAAGSIVQYLGFAISATTLMFCPNVTPTTLA